uniref:ATP-dependent Clp protease proteolytic subunit n=1 Tax=Volvocales sp. NrCl902 TaxID=2682054 RepID=A0A7G1GG77_9CHLO|nr:ATP-dependent Clp protease proteolytic subunit [Volvocales sp. NrCl902]
MVIGVPRVLYIWGDELPAQWTDIYNFIYRRRMIFLMQYLDDELCNQIVGLLINIHMEDRSKELESAKEQKQGPSLSKKENISSLSGYRSNAESGYCSNAEQASNTQQANTKTKARSVEDLLHTNEDLGIVEHSTLEQMTLQKITTDWLNWNCSSLPADYNFFHPSTKKQGARERFLNYKKEQSPSLEGHRPPFYAMQTVPLSAELLDVQKNWGKEWLSQSLLSQSLLVAQRRKKDQAHRREKYHAHRNSMILNKGAPLKNIDQNNNINNINNVDNNIDNTYSSFRLLVNFRGSHLFPLGIESKDFNLKKNNIARPYSKLRVIKDKDIITKDSLTLDSKKILGQRYLHGQYLKREKTNGNLFRLLLDKGQNSFSGLSWSKGQTESLSFTESMTNRSEKPLKYQNSKKAGFLLEGLRSPSLALRAKGEKDDKQGSRVKNNALTPTRPTAQQATVFDEEAKKVFVIINSFGGSVGNGITIHDALQFIKAGSLTLALGVAASAASLALAGGTIGERYVTEGCHVLLHQPQSSTSGQASDIWIDSEEIMKIRLDIAEVLSCATYRPRHKILRDLDRDFYLTATETIHYGLADEIASNDVLSSILEMTRKIWDYHDTKQFSLLEKRNNTNSSYPNTSTSV